MNITVKKHADLDPKDVGHVESVSLFYEGSNVIIFEVQLHTKYKGVEAFMDSDDGERSFWVGMDEVTVKLPYSFKYAHAFASSPQKWSVLVGYVIPRHNEPEVLWHDV